VLKKRLIPVVMLRNGSVVQSRGFKRYQIVGNPTTIVERLSTWAADELVYVDISRAPTHAQGRMDLGTRSSTNILSILGDVARRCFMPLSFGGGIRNLQQAEERIRAGADKIIINTQALSSPALITEAAESLGSQAVVISVDARRGEDGAYEVFSAGGREPSGRSPAAWAAECESRGAGEILVNSIDRDGGGQGYDLDLIRSVTSAVSIPVIALGGAGNWEHMATALEQTEASAVAAGNIFHHTEHSVFKAKQHLFERGANVRPPTLHEFDEFETPPQE
jgi:cyclase